MTSEAAPTRAYVWVWLPGATEPVVAGVLEASGDIIYFNYGRSYLARPEAVPRYSPELPLQAGRLRPLGGLHVAGCIRDAAPRRVGPARHPAPLARACHPRHRPRGAEPAHVPARVRL